MPAPRWGQGPGGYPPPGTRKPSLAAVIVAFIWVFVSAGVEVGFGLSAAGGSRQGGFHLGVGHVRNDILGYYAIPGAMLAQPGWGAPPRG